MRIGADYYPEHWPRERWETDAQLMRKAGFNVTRLAEFSWIKMEPAEGQYDFSWLDEAIDVLAREGVDVILCTPTASPPKWVYDRYPEATAVDAQGHRVPYGNRQSACMGSGSYRLLSERITRAMAEHYRDNPHVIGWQLDNEFWGPDCFCPSCAHAFQEFLRVRYGSIDRLNEAWGTAFWGHSYREFGEVPLPAHDHSNLSMVLDYRRWHSQKIVRFAADQVRILRAVCPHQFITHNLMGFAEQVDYYDLGELLDFVSWDYYYNGSSVAGARDAYAQGAAAHDLMRSIKHKNFWIMENSAGPLGWECFSRNLRPGELRRMTYQNVAHGADGQIWFRWRTCRFGTEQYWHGLLGHDGEPGRRYQEAAEVAHELQALWPALQGTAPRPQIAFLLDYEDRWALSAQKNSPELNYNDEVVKLHRSFARHGAQVEFVRPGDPLEGYRVLVLSTKYIVDEATAQQVSAFARQGGVVLVSYRTGVKDRNNLPHPNTLPGLLREAAGVRVEEYESVPQSAPYAVRLDGEVYAGAVLADWTVPEEARVLARYEEPGLEAYAALSENTYGAGTVFYLSTSLDLRGTEAVAAKVLTAAGLSAGQLPEQLEVCLREGNGRRLCFVLNHGSEPAPLPLSGRALVGPAPEDGILTLPGGQVAVVELAAGQA